MSSVPVVELGRSANELLKWGRDALRDAVFELPATARTVVGYHFGWSDRHGRPANGTRGKAFGRRRYCSGAAMRGQPSDMAHVAAAVELAHSFSLVHDDVMDGDHTRHHRPTVWHGVRPGPGHPRLHRHAAPASV
jgi:geranylgeranyl diphosphate synthase, type I